ncbi:MAG: N-acetyltransferase [candidate division Zixibacteria bacterium]|nr:N-acetyltransferase [candidate division Zixibacteria bacterium]
MDTITSKNNIDILEVENSSDLNTFIKIPFIIYRDELNWVAPLISERQEFFNKKKNPFYRAAKTRLFLARREGKFVGRIATCVNFNHNEFHEEKTGFFSFFDCIEDYEVAELLFKIALITLKKEGMDKILGPVNFSTNHEVGMLIEGYDSPPVIMMPYNKPYYNDFTEKFGFRKAKDLVAFKIAVGSNFDPRMRKLADRLRERAGITVRTLNMKDYDGEIDRIVEVYNKAWAKNWGFVPMSLDEFRHAAIDMKQIVDPDIVFIAEVQGKPVGFSLSLPNINQALIKIKGRLFPTGLMKLLWHTKVKNKVDSIRIVTLGLIPEYQKRGIDNIFYIETYDVGTKKGYKWGEMSWILEDNFAMVRQAELMGGTLYKKYRVYGMQV